jgi:hypothetical protein
MWSATATNRSASRSMSGSAGAMPAPLTFLKPQSSRPCRRRMTLHASRLKTRLRPCPMCKTLPSPQSSAPTWNCFSRGRSTASRRQASPWLARRRPYRPTSASPTARAPPCRRSNRIFSARTRMAFGVAMPVRATPCRCRRLPARAVACSAMPGTAPSATPTSWPRPKRWDATPPRAP